MTRITNELMRRTAPPPYAEAMQRSRPFEEVQNEYLAALEQRRNEETTDDAQALLEEQGSVASASVSFMKTNKQRSYISILCDCKHVYRLCNCNILSKYAKQKIGNMAVV